MIRKTYNLVFTIVWLGILTASQDTLGSSDRKRRLEGNHLETDTSKQLCPDNTTGSMDPSIQVCNEAMNLLEVTRNRSMGESSSSRTCTGDVTGNNDIIIIDDEVNTSKAIEILRESKSTKDENIFNDSKFIRMFKKYLEKLDREQDGEGVSEVVDILSNYENGLKLLCNMVGNSNLQFVTYLICALIYDPNSHNYTNGVFLYMLFCSPFPNLTADSIRTRFKMGFLNLLTTNQIVRVISSLLKDELIIMNEERIELVEMVFGHIDFAFDIDFSVDQVSTITMAILNSKVPEVFEQVFLTWKMWGIFGIEQQEAIFNSYCSNVAKGKIYKRETLVMLYLFVLNRDEPNFEYWKELKVDIKLKHGKSQVYRGRNDMLKMIANPYYYGNDINWVVDTFDNCLLDLPEELKTLNTSNFKRFTKLEFYKQDKEGYYYGKRYKIHVCYVFSKFNQDNVNSQESNDNGIALLDEVYFDIRMVKEHFQEFRRAKDKNFSKTSGNEAPKIVSDFNDKIEVKNAFGALRQIVQSKKYNHEVFNGLLAMIRTNDANERVYVLFLFLLTKEDILRDVRKTSFWIERKENIEKTKSKRVYSFNDVEDLFMYNLDVDSELKLHRTCSTSIYLRKIYGFLSDLINKNDGIYRERHLCQRFFFHPRFKRFNELWGFNYICALNDTSMLATKEDHAQLARDLILNDYYELIIKGKHKFIIELVDLKNMKLFSEAVETFKDKVTIYKKRERAILNHYSLQ